VVAASFGLRPPVVLASVSIWLDLNTAVAVARGSTGATGQLAGGFCVPPLALRSYALTLLGAVLQASIPFLIAATPVTLLVH